MLVQILSKTRPLRVLIAFKRHQVQSLNRQLADLLELHADSVAKVRTAQSAEQVLHRRSRSGSGHTQQMALVEDRPEKVLISMLPGSLLLQGV